MENTEIIKTEDPNIIIEKTTIEKEIDISHISESIAGYQEMIKGIQNNIDILNSYKGLPVEVLKIIEEKISLLEGEIFSYQEQINKLQNLIN
jgi:hypothetical protein